MGRRRTEHEHAAARRVKGQLHGREAARRKVGVGAAAGDAVQVERQLEARAGDGDGLGELRTPDGRGRVCGDCQECALCEFL